MNEQPSRQSRKLDHLRHALELADGPLAAGFADIQLIHNCLPELNWDELTLQTTLFGHTLAQPLLLNAITGGATDVAAVNGLLASFAAEAGLPMAVGSQYAAVVDAQFAESYRIVRTNNPNGILFANLGAHAATAQATAAVEMIGAQALQIHLNPAQELAMAEGDRDFRGYLENIAAIADAVNVPVIVKEVGFGMARAQVRALLNSGIAAIDVGGAGGTNFAAIEASRQPQLPSPDLLGWGIPTAVSAVETLQTVDGRLPVIISGGVRTPLDAVKALALGATAVALATPFLKQLLQDGLAATLQSFEQFCTELKRFMLLTGAVSPKNLAEQPLLIRGATAAWLTTRGIPVHEYANRDQQTID